MSLSFKKTSLLIPLSLILISCKVDVPSPLSSNSTPATKTNTTSENNNSNSTSSNTISNPQNCAEIKTLLTCALDKYEDSPKSKVQAALTAVNSVIKIGVRTDEGCKGAFDGLKNDFTRLNFDNKYLQSCNPDENPLAGITVPQSTNNSSNAFRFTEITQKRVGGQNRDQMNFEYDYDPAQLPENSYLYSVKINSFDLEGKDNKGWSNSGSRPLGIVQLFVGIKGENTISASTKAGIMEFLNKKQKLTFTLSGDKYSTALDKPGNSFELEFIFRQDNVSQKEAEEKQITIKEKLVL